MSFTFLMKSLKVNLISSVLAIRTLHHYVLWGMLGVYMGALLKLRGTYIVLIDTGGASLFLIETGGEQWLGEKYTWLQIKRWDAEDCIIILWNVQLISFQNLTQYTIWDRVIHLFGAAFPTSSNPWSPHCPPPHHIIHTEYSLINTVFSLNQCETYFKLWSHKSNSFLLNKCNQIINLKISLWQFNFVIYLSLLGLSPAVRTNECHSIFKCAFHKENYFQSCQTNFVNIWIIREVFNINFWLIWKQFH